MNLLAWVPAAWKQASWRLGSWLSGAGAQAPRHVRTIEGESRSWVVAPAARSFGVLHELRATLVVAPPLRGHAVPGETRISALTDARSSTTPPDIRTALVSVPASRTQTIAWEPRTLGTTT